MMIANQNRVFAQMRAGSVQRRLPGELLPGMLVEHRAGLRALASPLWSAPGSHLPCFRLAP